MSLLVKPKTISELSKELLVKQTTIRAHLKVQLNFNKSLINLGLVQKVGDRILGFNFKISLFVLNYK